MDWQAPQKRVQAGERVALPPLRSVNDRPVVQPAPGLIHLQFRRFAGCPICNLHLRTFALQAARLRDAGVQEIAVFHARSAELQPYVAQLPFPVIADPDKLLYKRFGVEAGARALLDPRVWPSILRAVAYATYMKLARGLPAPALEPTGGRLGFPADFLLASDGRVLASKYGQHADDQWSVDDVLSHALSCGSGAA